MDIREAIKAADGQATVSKACVAHGYAKVTRFTVQYWFTNNRLPSSEWTGETNYAVVICSLAKVFGHDISPIDLCPGAGQYMAQQDEKAS